MQRTDLILLHAPSVVDFRTRPWRYGPISDVVPSGPIFEMYPIGFVTIMGYLQRHGLSVRIINLAARMLASPKFDPGNLIGSLHPLAFGIDLHWLVHAQGSLEIARLIKDHHPHTPVIFGGLSSSYYHRELMEFPQVDFVIRGDCAEEPLRRLLVSLLSGKPPCDVPNLTWRAASGDTVINALSHIPSDLDDIPLDYGAVIRSTVRHRDFVGHTPFRNWWKYPITVMLPWKGCVHNCVSCGGARDAYKKVCGRESPAYRSPAVVAEQLVRASRFSGGPIMVLGDLRQAGEEYAFELLDRLGSARIFNHVAVELSKPASRAYLEHIARSLPNFNLEISPESGDEAVRRAFGRPFGNEDLERTIDDALQLGCRRVDLFFMVGLPKQTPGSVDETVKYCGHLLDRFSRYDARRLLPCISPLAPFVDPGSPAFEKPGAHGYRLLSRSLEEHRLRLLEPSWKYMLNYETQWMDRDQIVSSTYRAAEGLNDLKAKQGIISKNQAARIAGRIGQTRAALEQVDKLIALGRSAWEETPKSHRAIIGGFQAADTCRKEELEWPLRPLRFKPGAILGAVLTRQEGPPDRVYPHRSCA